MRKLVLACALMVAMTLAPVVQAADHGHGKHEAHGSAAHEEVVDGVKVTFTIQPMAEAMKEMGMPMPKGVKETHHLSLALTDPKTGSNLSGAEVKVKIQGPDKAEQTKDLMGMHGHYGGDFVMAKKGKYGVMSKFKVKDGKVRSAKFWYEVK